MTTHQDTTDAHSFASRRQAARSRVWQALDGVALPDSRFHRDFSSFIPDFNGSRRATSFLCSTPEYKNAKLIFITPDNCTEKLRLRALEDGKALLTTTYGIKRGFWILNAEWSAGLKEALRGDGDGKWTARGRLERKDCRVAAMLDGMERFGLPISWAEIRSRKLRVDLAITGTGGIDRYGVRFGKGHGFFDLEWAMLYEAGAVGASLPGEGTQRLTPVFGIVHDCQIVDEKFPRDFCDTRCVAVAAPSGLRRFEAEEGMEEQPECGIVWERLPVGLREEIPPLAEMWEARESTRETANEEISGDLKE